MTRIAWPLPRASFGAATNLRKSPFIRNSLMPRSNAALSTQAARSIRNIPVPGCPVEVLTGICGSQRKTSTRRLLDVCWVVAGVAGAGRRKTLGGVCITGGGVCAAAGRVDSAGSSTGSSSKMRRFLEALGAMALTCSALVRVPGKTRRLQCPSTPFFFRLRVLTIFYYGLTYFHEISVRFLEF